MGNVTSRTDDGSLVYLRDQNRCTRHMVAELRLGKLAYSRCAVAVTSIRITNSRNRILYNILPNTFPATRYSVRKDQDDEAVIEYVQVGLLEAGCNIHCSLLFMTRIRIHRQPEGLLDSFSA